MLAQDPLTYHHMSVMCESVARTVGGVSVARQRTTIQIVQLFGSGRPRPVRHDTTLTMVCHQTVSLSTSVNCIVPPGYQDNLLTSQSYRDTIIARCGAQWDAFSRTRHCSHLLVSIEKSVTMWFVFQKVISFDCQIKNCCSVLSPRSSYRILIAVLCFFVNYMWRDALNEESLKCCFTLLQMSLLSVATFHHRSRQKSQNQWLTLWWSSTVLG